MRDDPVLIEAAINGVVPKSWNPHVPHGLEEVRADIRAYFAAGASIVHNHAAPGAAGPNGLDFYVRAWEPVLAERPGAIVYPTLGSQGTSAQRIGHFEPLARRGLLRVGAIDPGSTNLGVLGDDGLPVPSDSVYANSFAFVAEGVALCRSLGLAMTFAIFEPTFLHTVLAWARAGALPPGTWIKFYFGGAGGYPGIAPRERLLPFGLPPTRAALDAYLEILGEAKLPWGVSAMGGDVFECGIARLALERGGHLHVGLESYAGKRQPTNAELVREAVALCREVGREPLAWDRVADQLGFPKPATDAPLTA